MTSENPWLASWLDKVADGSATMSQRKVTSLEKAGSNISDLKRAANKRNIHVLRLTDDKGNDLLAASLEKFQIIS